MDFELLHPRDQIVSIMERIYGYGMTTTSGGNISVLDDEGDIWITPAGVDKGMLKPEDIVCVKPDGGTAGVHRPSIELPFHTAIYAKRPDIKAILHAHPAALVSFSIIRQVPDTGILPNARLICGEVGYAPYALPGSRALGEHIANTFAKGYNTVLLENHGAAAAGTTLLQAFKRFETLDFCARLITLASALGKPHSLNEEELNLVKDNSNLLAEFEHTTPTSREKEARKAMCGLIRRAYDRMLVTSAEGTFSVRIDRESFLITPYGVDRKNIEPRDMVLIRNGMREAGKIPSRSVILHEKVYEKHAGINAIIVAHPPHIMAFGVSRTKFDSWYIPESYLLLKNVPLLRYGKQFLDKEEVAEILSPSCPLAIVENDCILTTGASLLQAFDRLEVAEFSAKAIILAKGIGTLVPINSEQMQEIERAFGDA